MARRLDFSKPLPGGQPVYSLSKVYGDIPKGIDAQTLLDHYDAENVIDNGDEWIIHSCLLDKVDTHHEHGDRNPSAAINRETLAYSCFTYSDDNGKSAGSLWWFLSIMEEGSAARVTKLLDSLYVSENTIGDTFKDKLSKALQKRSQATEELPRFHPAAVKKWLNPTFPYFKDRGLSEEVCDTYMLGYNSDEDRIVIPHWYDGTIVGWQGRKLNGPATKDSPKYKNSKDFPKDRTLFNLDTVRSRNCNSVTVVESALTVLYAETLYRLTGNENFANFVAAFAVTINTPQLELLKEFSTVIIAFDNDEEGAHHGMRVYDYLKNSTSVKWMVLPGNYKDLDQIKDHALAEKVVNRPINGISGYVLAKDKWETWKKWKSAQQKK